MTRHWVWAALVALAGGAAAAQTVDRDDRAETQARPEAQTGDGGIATSDAFERACVDLLHGRTPAGGEKAVQALQKACNDLMADRSAERIRFAQRQEEERERREALQEQQQAQGAQAGQGRGAVGQGEGVLAAFEQAGRELVGDARARAMGMRQRGAVESTIISNPVGWFNGLGVNAELFRSFGPAAPKFSWITGARYSKTTASNGTATSFGLLGGADWFVVGRNNEGVRVGPRVELALGRENFEGSTTFARLGLSGEAGYNFIALNGITGLLAAGIGGRVAGDENESFDSFTGGEFGPYLKLGVGFSW
jgi:hypothetical protein